MVMGMRSLICKRNVLKISNDKGGDGAVDVDNVRETAESGEM